MSNTYKQDIPMVNTQQTHSNNIQRTNTNKHNKDDDDVWNIDYSAYEGAKSMSFIERFKMKSAQDPLVPIGCALTLTALSGGLYSFMRGKRQHYQKFMWARVAFQGVTLVALFASAYRITANAKQQNTLTPEQEYRKRYE